VRGVRHRCGEDFTLDVPRLSVPEGNCLGLAGSNGSGKSTFLRILAGIEEPQEGEVRFKGAGLAQGGSREIAMLLQDPYLLKKPVFDNVVYGLRARRETAELPGRASEALRLVGLEPSRYLRRRWHELSGGESRRVALAARLALRPRVLLLDEPTASVDQESAGLIKKAVESFRDRFGTTLVVSSHDFIWLSGVSGEILRMYDGRIVEHGSGNLLRGPWRREKSGLWSRLLADGQKILVVDPPDADAVALLDPTNILLGVSRPGRISAQNILRGRVSGLASEREGTAVRVEADAGGVRFNCSLTRRAADSLRLLPGKRVWIVFKASSVHWH
jgi:tungstate transport system ATP-binding protein